MHQGIESPSFRRAASRTLLAGGLCLLPSCAGGGPGSTAPQPPTPAHREARATVEPAEPQPPGPAPAELACTLQDTDVPFVRPLMLLHQLPPRGAMVEHPFAFVRRAAGVRVEVPVGEVASIPLRAEIDTAMVHLRGIAHAEHLPLFPAQPSTFAGIVTPLANHPLRWSETTQGAVLLALTPPSRVTWSLRPEWRPCAYLRLRQAAPFAVDARPAPAPRRKLALAPGGWRVFAAPSAPEGSLVTVDVRAGDDLWLIEEHGAAWARVFWRFETATIDGWLNRSEGSSPTIGHGSGTGSGSGRSRCPSPSTCSADLPLLVDDRGVAREVGRVKAGASVLLGATTGALRQVTVCDPDIEWADGVPTHVPANRAAVCAPGLR